MILGIYGAKGLGWEVMELAKTVQQFEHKWDKIIFIDDDVLGAESFKGNNSAYIISFVEAKTIYSPTEIEFAIAIGEPSVRKAVFSKVIDAGYHCAILVHPDVNIPANAELKQGVIVQTRAVISCNTIIQENTFIQIAACIGHNCNVGAHNVISTNVVLAGACRTGEAVYIGIGVPIKESIEIGENSVIGMGSVVLRDIPENVIAMGNPARPMKHKDDSRVFKN